MRYRTISCVTIAVASLLGAACATDDESAGPPNADPSTTVPGDAPGTDLADGATTASDPAIVGYDRLDLTTPPQAVELFSRAFVSGDFVTATLLLDHDPQLDLLRATSGLQPAAFLTPPGAASYMDEAVAALTGDVEVAAFLARVAMLWRVGMTEGALPIDLSEGISNTTVESVDTTTAAVTATLTATGEPVDIELVLSVDGNWRIRQFRVEGAEAAEGLFAGHAPSGSTPVDPAQLSGFRDRHDLSTPRAAAASWLTAMQNENWIGVFVLAAEPTQENWFRAVTSVDFDRFIGAPWGAELAERWGGLGEAEHAQVEPLVREFWMVMERAGRLPLAVGSFSIVDSSDAQGPEVEGSASRIVEVVVNDQPFEVTLIEDSLGDWRPYRIAPADTDIEDAASGIVIPGPAALVGPDAPGVICADALVRFDCTASPPAIGASNELEAAVDEIRSRVDAGGLTEAEALIEINALTRQFSAAFAEPDAICAVMQRGDLEPIEIAVERETVELLARDYCPGDPSVIPSG